MAHAATGWVIRLLLATALVLAGAHYQARTVVDGMLWPLAHTLAWFAPDFQIVQFGFATDRDNHSLAAIARLKRTVVMGETAVVPDDSPMVVGANVGTVLQPVLVALVLALAWPGSVAEILLRLVLLVPPLAIVLLVDTPASMAGWLWFSLQQIHDPGRFSPLVWWNTFLNGGGRLVLGLIAAAGAISGAAGIVRVLGVRVRRMRRSLGSRAV
jgi:hypothetical protein